MTRPAARASLAAAPEVSVVILASAGDDAAFAELVLRRQAKIRDLLRRLCGDAALADDLAQQVFVQAWRSLKTLRAPGAFGGWLRRIAVNTWRQAARRRGEMFEDVFDEAADTVADGGPSQADQAAGRIDLERALARLAPAQRLCVVLAYAEGLSHPEIAEAVDLPLGTVKSHVTRGSARLRALLALETDDGR